ncbi:MAG: DUF3667 domain-containing protein [Pseudomonadota bacterium]
MSEQKEPSDLQSTVEDAFGFNFRSLKTINDLFIRPRTVFEAYAARDRVSYTPAIKIWLGLIGLQVITNAVFGGWEGLIRRTFEADPATAAVYEEVTAGRVDEFLVHYASALSMAQAPVVGVFSALSVFVLGWFNKSVPWSGRFNIAMGVLTAGSIMGVLTMAMFLIPAPPGWLYFATTGLIVFVYFVTFGRGAKGTLAQTNTGAWIKAAIFSIVLIILVFLAYLAMSMGATVYGLAMIGPPPA